MKIKKGPCIILAIVLALIVFLVCYIIKINSVSYKLQKVGYNEEETKALIKLNTRIDDILTMKYNRNMVGILSEKYYKDKHFNDYLDYLKKKKTTDYTKVVALVNVGADKEFYTDTVETDTSKGTLMLVNKYNYITKDFDADTEDVELSYAYEGVRLNKTAYDAFLEMVKACNSKGNHLVALDGYRDYKYQSEQYEHYKAKGGTELADSYAARPGYSEHQTGLAIDFNVYPNDTDEDFDTFKEFKWLQKHAVEYGFILRYPKGKEDITGYAYESWHYRYVGKEVAQKINELGITYDEYYAYFIEK